MSRDVDSVCLTIQELVEFGDELVELSKGEDGTILGSRVNERLGPISCSSCSYLSPRRTVSLLLISRLTEEQNARIDGKHGAGRGILEDLETLYDRVANPIFEPKVFVALVWFRAGLEEKG